MAYRRRRRRARTTGFISNAVRNYSLGILFVLLGAFIIGVVSYLVSLVPETSIAIGNVSLSNRLILNLITWVAGIFLVLVGIRRFGLRL
jgi:uncharacterized BrkB/YihY/UPF0761 family membrane protein